MSPLAAVVEPLFCISSEAAYSLGLFCIGNSIFWDTQTKWTKCLVEKSIVDILLVGEFLIVAWGYNNFCVLFRYQLG